MIFQDRAVAVRSVRQLGAYPNHRTDSWLMVGQDGGQSIAIGEKTLFVFSDTLMAARRALQGRAAPSPIPTSQVTGQGIFLANCAALAPTDAPTMRAALAGLRYYQDAEEIPREILSPSDDERAAGLRFWPEHGIFLDGKVYLYYLGIETLDHSSVWAFRNRGAGLAVLDPETGVAEIVRRDDDWNLWPAAGDADDVHFGVQVVKEGAYVYVFGSVRRQVYTTTARLARVAAASIANPDAYEFFGGEGGAPCWTAERTAARDLGVCSDEYSVSYNPYLGRYVMVYTYAYHKTLWLRTASMLEGPYGAPLAVGVLPSRASSELAYLAWEHPTFCENDGETIYISYSQPHFTPNGLLALRFR